MTPDELTACRERHTHAEAPSAALGGLKNISLVYSGLGRQAHEDRGKLLDEVLALQIALDCCVDKGGFEMACDELRRVTDVLATWAKDYPRDRTADVDAALYCAREFLSKVKSEERIMSDTSTSMADVWPEPRDFKLKPYTADERRVVDYIQEATKKNIGGGDDPIGFLMSAHALLISDRNRALEALGARRHF